MQAKRFEVRDSSGNVVGGLSGVSAENALVQMLIPQAPIDSLAVGGTTPARDRRSDGKLTDRFTIIRLEDAT